MKTTLFLSLLFTSFYANAEQKITPLDMASPMVKQCITKDSIEDMDKQLKQSFGAEQQCQFDILKTTNKTFAGQLNCAGMITTVDIKVISPKRHEANIVSNMAEMGSVSIKTVSEWKSSTCPAGI